MPYASITMSTASTQATTVSSHASRPCCLQFSLPVMGPLLQQVMTLLPEYARITALISGCLTHFTGWASGNFQVPSMTSWCGRYRRIAHSHPLLHGHPDVHKLAGLRPVDEYGHIPRS